jgi:hypothetical protein
VDAELTVHTSTVPYNVDNLASVFLSVDEFLNTFFPKIRPKKAPTGHYKKLISLWIRAAAITFDSLQCCESGSGIGCLFDP